MTQTNNDYNRLNKLIKKNDKNLEVADIREGLTAILSIRVPEKYLQFEGQTKGRLGTSEARSAVDQVVSEKLNRSEERRVGKECRYGWGRYQSKEKEEGGE